MAANVDEEEDVGQGETLEPCGALEADIGAKFDQIIASIDPQLKWEIDPAAHQVMRPEMMFIREEMRMAKRQTLAARRVMLKKMFLRDFAREDRELRQIGYAYTPRYP